MLENRTNTFRLYLQTETGTSAIISDSQHRYTARKSKLKNIRNAFYSFFRQISAF